MNVYYDSFMTNRNRYAYVTLGLFLVGLALYGILRNSDTDVTKIVSTDKDLQATSLLPR